MNKTRDYGKGELFIKVGFFLSILVIGYICSCRVSFPGSTTDELAYLSQAARYAGMGNKELMQYYSFYGQGVSLLWSLIFRLFPKNYILIYRAIICLNSFFLALSFLVSYYCGRILYPSWNRILLLLACYLIILYPCNIYYMQIAGPENLLWLLFWISFYSYLKILYSRKWIYSLLYAVTVSFMLIVHYRTLIIVLVSCMMFFFLLCRKEVCWYELAIFLCGIGAGYIIFKILKQGHFAYVGGINELSAVNIEFSYLDLIIDRISKLGKYIIGCVCKLYYFVIVGSVVMLNWIIALVEPLKDSIRQKKIKIDSVMIFQLLMMICNLIAFAMPLPMQISRYDYVVYVRYLENIMGPILLSGLYFFVKRKEGIKLRLPVYFACMECIMLFIYQTMQLTIVHMFAIDGAVGIGALIGFRPTDNNIMGGLCKSFFLSGFILFIYSKIDKEKICKVKINMKVLVLVILFLYWGYIGIEANVNNYNQRNQIKHTYFEVVKIIEEVNSKHIIYIRDDEKQPVCEDGKYLQWALGNDYLFNVMNYDEIESEGIQNDAVYVSTKDSNIGKLLELGGIKYYADSKMEVYIIQD